ncbi:hypothetical protein L204_100655 [Cryptococcus depauperatus]
MLLHLVPRRRAFRHVQFTHCSIKILSLLHCLVLFYYSLSKANMSEHGSNPPDEKPKAATPPPDSNTLNIRIVNSNHEEVFFKIKRKTKLNKLKIAYADRVGTDVNAIRLLFDGARILEDQTADDLELEDGDALEVQLEQVGGC